MVQPEIINFNLDHLHLTIPVNVEAIKIRVAHDKTNLFSSQLFQDESILLNFGLNSNFSFKFIFRVSYIFSVLRIFDALTALLLFIRISSILLYSNAALNDTKLGLEDELLGCELLVKRLPVSVRGSLRFALMVVKRSTALRPVALRFGREFLEQLLVLLLTHSVPREFVLEHSFMIECD